MDRIWMVLEDDPVIRTILTAIMTLWDIKPLAFKDGYQAADWLDKVERGELKEPLPEVALLDIAMPGPQGDQIGKRMRSLPATAGIPIFMMTAFHFKEEDRNRILEEVKPVSILGKPLPDPDDLRNLLEKAIAENALKLSVTQKVADNLRAAPENNATESSMSHEEKKPRARKKRDGERRRGWNLLRRSQT